MPADRVADTEPVERTQGVGPQAQRRAAGGPQPVAFAHLDVQTTLVQGDRGRESTDPAADDDRLHGDVLQT